MEYGYQGRSYFWNGKAWLDEDRLRVPDRLGYELSDRFLDSFLDDRQDGWVSRMARLRQAGYDADSRPTLRLLGKACRRRLERDPEDSAAVAVLCSCLRYLGEAGQAVELTRAYLDCRNPAVLTSRAAALCDLGRWDEAEAVLAEVEPSAHTQQLRRRIQSHRVPTQARRGARD